ncbi:hypothetical protein HDU98_011050 [Podochytrium sp. JEL0797]|nr:hypothetical protein HDU98_011050 [Podochytrium sp. JEL0797]
MPHSATRFRLGLPLISRYSSSLSYPKIAAIAYDTETHDWIDGLPRTREHIGRVVQLGWVSFTNAGDVVSRNSHIFKPNGYRISAKAEQFHGITNERAELEGRNGDEMLRSFLSHVVSAGPECTLVAHKMSFDSNAVLAELDHRSYPNISRAEMLLDPKLNKNTCDTCKTRHLVRLDPMNEQFRKRRFGMRLGEMFEWLCADYPHREQLLAGAHDAGCDAEMAGAIYFELKKRGVLGAGGCERRCSGCRQTGHDIRSCPNKGPLQL